MEKIKIVRNKIQKVLPIIKMVAFFVILGLASLSLLTLLPLRTPIKPYIVLSGSMNPTILEGSIVFVKRGFNDIKKGNIVTFKRPGKPQENVTHRIVGEDKSKGRTVYITKGDANTAPDLWVVPKESIWGKAIFSVPFLGYVISFAKTKLGVILLIALPLVIIALGEARIIYSEIKKMRKKSKVVTLLALITLFLPNKFAVSSAVFSDPVFSTNQQISTGDWTPPESEVDFLPDYQNNSQFFINYTASDDSSGVKEVRLYYRYHFGGWQLFGTDTVIDNEFQFTSPAGDGLYEFFTIAIDNAGNIEDDWDENGILEEDELPFGGDTFTTVDTTPPVTMLSMSEPRKATGDLIVNGDFETGNLTGWSSGGDGVVETNASAHSGNYSALIGFPDTVLPPDDKLGVSYIEQLINWTSGIPTVSLWYRLQTSDTVGESFFSAWLKDPLGLIDPVEIIHDGWDDVLLYPFDQTDLGWEKVTYQANEFEDKSQMKLYCEVVDKSEGLYSTWTFIDDVKVTTGDNLLAGTTKLSLFSSDASGSGTIGSEYNLDNSSWIDYEDPIQVDVEGNHVLEYRSTDEMGNAEGTKKINLKATHKVVINEVYYHGSEEKEWVELYNASSETVNLNEWKIYDNYSSDDLPNVDLASGQFAVIVPFGSTLTGIADGALVITLSNNTIGNGLADAGDKVVLKNSLDQGIDTMSYGADASVFTLAGVASGHSLARKPKGIDTDTAGDWEDLTTPNPGTNPHPPEENKEEENQSPTPTPEPSPEPSSEPTPEPILNPVPEIATELASPSALIIAPVPSPEPSPDPDLSIPEPIIIQEIFNETVE